jgi:hypothetical protein
MTPTPIPSSTTTPSTQAAASLSHVEKAESTMSSMTNASSSDKTLSSDSDAKKVSTSIKITEAAKTIQFKGKTGGNAGTVNHSAEPNSISNSSLKNQSSSCKEKPSFSRHQTTKDEDKKQRKALAVSSHSSSVTSSFPSKTETSTSQLHSMTHKKQKLQDDDDDDDDDSVEEDYGEHDPTTTEGQMSLNPNISANAACTEAKREYNRRNAARARTRNKHMVGDLQEKVHSLTRCAEDLQRSNDVLQAQLEVLQSQNRDLLVSRKDSAPKVQAQPSNDIMSQLLEQLQEKREAQQQVQSITQLLNSLNGQGDSSQIPSSLQGGQQVGANLLAGMPGQGSSSHLLGTVLGKAQQQTQTFRPHPEISNPHTGLQGQSMSQLLSSFGIQGQTQTFRPQQEISNPHTRLQGQSMSQLLSSFGLQGQQQQQQQQQQQRSQPQHHVSGASHDQQHLQQLLASMPTEVLYNMLYDLSQTGNNDLNAGRM